MKKPDEEGVDGVVTAASTVVPAKRLSIVTSSGSRNRKTFVFELLADNKHVRCVRRFILVRLIKPQE
jgi:hypothetical protein